MPRQGGEFELAYADMYELDKEKYKVESPGHIKDKITGADREVDVLIKFKDEIGNDRSIVVECRDRKNGEDVTSIEQLIQKKEDMEVDIYVISTLYKFTPNAIKKALHYGVIIETAEMINKEKIDKLDKEFFYDVFYIIPSITKLVFLSDSNKIITFKELIKNINIIDRQKLTYELNYLLLANYDFNKVLEQIDIKPEDYFKNNKNYWCSFNNTLGLTDNKPEIFRKFNIKSITYSIEIKPFRLSLPINKSLSTFEVGEKKNKAFKVIFGNDEDNVTIGYLDDKKVIAKMHLKLRKYHRVVGGNMSVNTIFPKDAEICFEMDDTEKLAINSFNYELIM